jgi:hypothetical protein
MLSKIQHTVGAHADAKLHTYALEAQELSDFLALIASVRTTQEQRVDFDTRVGRLRVEARVVLEEAYVSIEVFHMHSASYFLLLFTLFHIYLFYIYYNLYSFNRIIKHTSREHCNENRQLTKTSWAAQQICLHG